MTPPTTKRTANPTRKPAAKAAGKTVGEAAIIDAELVEDDDTPGTDLELATPREVVQITAEMLVKRRADVVEFMAKAMVEGIHNDYAKLPGCGDRPVLLQPGADKLRLFLGIDAMSERTFFEQTSEKDGVGEYRVAYRTTATDQWGVRVSKERFASHVDEGAKFYQYGKPLPLNTVASRAEKRSYVAAIAAFTGVREVFGSGEAQELIPDTARAIVVALYQLAGLDRQARMAESQGARLGLPVWPTWLGAAIDTIGDVREWDDTPRKALFELLVPANVGPTDVPQLVDAAEGSL